MVKNNLFLLDFSFFLIYMLVLLINIVTLQPKLLLPIIIVIRNLIL